MSEELKDITDGKITDMTVVAVKQIYGNNGFVIFACKDGLSVKGRFDSTIVPGAEYIVTGKMSEYKGKPQIDASSIKQKESSDSKNAFIASFLADNIKGIGEKTGNLLAEEFGEDVLEVLFETPFEAAKRIPSLSSSVAEQAALQIEAEKDRFDRLLALRLHGLSKSQSESVLEGLGMDCVEKLNENPYIMIRCDGIGFETCERIASGEDQNLLDPLRFAGAMRSVLSELHYGQGHTRFDIGLIRDKTFDLLKKNNGLPGEREVCESVFDEAVEYAVKDKSVAVFKFDNGKCVGVKTFEEGCFVALKELFDCEASIKKEIESFIKAKKVVPPKDVALERIRSIAGESGFTLSPKQEEALFLCMYSSISIITGGPGTGKTTITGILARHLKNEKISFEFCAPTGRAAKRLSDMAGVKAHTIHRLLETNVGNREEGKVFYGKNRLNPIDARVIIVDESSMVDTELFDALLKAIKPDSSLILIGDPDQLPSVGPGNILADLLSCASIPRVMLDYVFRQEDESSIASNSVRILEGKELIGNDDDFVMIKEQDEEVALEKIKELASELKGEDMVILSPTKLNLLGTSSLNRELQALMKEEDADYIRTGGDLVLHPGDRVMQTRNNYGIEFFDHSTNETLSGVYNGEIGTVTGSDFLLGTCNVRFDDGKTVTYDKKMLEDIDLAYAMTVHKAQGCEFDTVIIALGKMNYKLSNRKLLYTAVTRGKKKVILVYHGNSLDRMLRSTDEQRRDTTLRDLLSLVEKRHGPWES